MLWQGGVVALASMQCRLEPVGGAGNMAGAVFVVLARWQNSLPKIMAASSAARANRPAVCTLGSRLRQAPYRSIRRTEGSAVTAGTAGGIGQTVWFSGQSIYRERVTCIQMR